MKLWGWLYAFFFELRMIPCFFYYTGSYRRAPSISWVALPWRYPLSLHGGNFSTEKKKKVFCTSQPERQLPCSLGTGPSSFFNFNDSKLMKIPKCRWPVCRPSKRGFMLGIQESGGLKGKLLENQKRWQRWFLKKRWDIWGSIRYQAATWTADRPLQSSGRLCGFDVFRYWGC